MQTEGMLSWTNDNQPGIDHANSHFQGCLKVANTSKRLKSFLLHCIHTPDRILHICFY